MIYYRKILKHNIIRICKNIIAIDLKKYPSKALQGYYMVLLQVLK